ncbi:GFA family protein [Roseibium sp.]|uniref:GFA family protein n=1 Tax=Roseibium sp. TaxID=1936156 RepID=UPI003D130E2E
MGHRSFPVEGACRCGNTRFEISSAPLITSACHCRGCQRMSSSAYSLTAIMPAPAFKVVAGNPVKGGAQGPDANHYFCPDCKTWMFTRIPGFDQIVNVRSTLLDDLSWTEPYMETMTSEKLPWARTPAKRSYEKFPEMDEFQGLMADFAKEEDA